MKINRETKRLLCVKARQANSGDISLFGFSVLHYTVLDYCVLAPTGAQRKLNLSLDISMYLAGLIFFNSRH